MTFSRLKLFLLRFIRSLWFRPILYAGLALGALAATPLLESYVPDDLADRLSDNNLDRVLGVLASSMLAVAVFSVGAMVQALQAAATAATPRARPLLTSDQTAQVAISTFIGAFVFAVLGLVGVAFGLYTAAARVVMIGLTLAMIVGVVGVLIAWTRRLSDMGGVRQAIEVIERTTAQALAYAVDQRFLGGSEAGDIPSNATVVSAAGFGAVQMIDAPTLQSIAEEIEADLYVVRREGDQAHPARPLLHVAFDAPRATLSEEAEERLRACFLLGHERSFEHDPRFGLIVLSEIGSRALSPAVNDPGTAIEVIHAETRLLAGYAEALAAAEGEAEEPERPRLRAAPVEVEELMRDAYRAVARDGAGVVEAAVRLQASLGALAAAAPALFGALAQAHSADAAKRAAGACPHEADVDAVRTARRKAGFGL